MGEAGRCGGAVGGMAKARSWKVLHPMRGRALLEFECVWCPGEGRDQAGEEIGVEGMGLGKV